MEEERDSCTQEIIRSTEPYRLVVAGAGTGKSFTMLQILESNPGKNYLVLTLTNELINDLEQDLGEHAHCWTFHKLIRDIFKNDLKKNKIIYPKLSAIINADTKILGLGCIFLRS